MPIGTLGDFRFGRYKKLAWFDRKTQPKHKFSNRLRLNDNEIMLNLRFIILLLTLFSYFAPQTIKGNIIKAIFS